MKQDAESTLVLFASLHLDEETAPAFIEDYRAILRELAPSVILVELSPEQLAGTATCHSKPEYAAAILPVARELGARVIPIQMATEPARDWERRMQALQQELADDPRARPWLEYMRAEQEAALAAMLEIACRPGGIEYFQSREYDRLYVEPQYAALARFSPQLAALYDEWNQAFLERIEKALREAPGERFLATIGGHHKYWLWNRLAGRAAVRLYDLAGFRAGQPAT